MKAMFEDIYYLHFFEVLLSRLAGTGFIVFKMSYKSVCGFILPWRTPTTEAST